MSTTDDQARMSLLEFAYQVLPALTEYPRPHWVATDALDRARRHLAGESITAHELGEYLNHSDPDMDLSAQFSFVEDSDIAHAALDVVTIAVGVIAHAVYVHEELPMPDPILLATPDAVDYALAAYDRLVAQGLVAPRSTKGDA